MKYIPEKSLACTTSLRKTYLELREAYNGCYTMALHMLLENTIMVEDDSRDLSRDMHDMFGVSLTSDAGAVLLFCVKTPSAAQGDTMIIPRVEEVIRKHFSVFSHVLFFNANQSYGCYLSPRLLEPGDAELLQTDIMTELVTLANAACDELAQESIHISIALSHLACGTSIRQLYRQALVVRDHCNSEGMRVATVADLPAPVARDKVWVAVCERRFMSSVIERNFFQAASALNEIMDGMIKESQPTLEQIRSNVFQRLETVLAICGENLHPDIQSGEVYTALENIMRAEDFFVLKDRMFDFFVIADDCLGLVQAEDKYLRVKAFIEKNHTCVSMGAAMICDEFKFSSSYLSKLVRNETGGSVVDLIHSVRIAEARMLLETTSLTISEIADRVGFTNRWTFIRAFKNLESIPPSAYREFFK